MGAQRLWTDEMDAALRRLVDERQSAGQIATVLSGQLKFAITRNSVIGRCGRLNLKLNGHANRAGQHGGWERRASPKRPRAPKAAPRTAEAKKPVKPKPRHRTIPRAVQPVEVQETVAVEPGPASVLFDKMEPEHCRWPLWPNRGRTPLDQMFVCGEPADFRPYCAAHHALATPRRAAPLLEELS
jgi:hypothetical protein